MFLPFVLLVAITLLCSGIFVSSEPPDVLSGTSVVLYVFRFTAFIPNFVVIVDNFINPHDFGLLLNKILFVCNLMENKLNAKFQWHKLKSECVLNFLMCMTVIFVTHIVRMCILFVYDVKTEFAIFFIQFLKTLSILHVLFYVNLFKFIIITLNNAILHKDLTVVMPLTISLNVECKRSKEISQILFLQIRVIHFKLWEVVRLFNAHFGWFLVSIMLESNISATNAFYGAFVYFTKMDEFYYISRKYLFISIFCCYFLSTLFNYIKKYSIKYSLRIAQVSIDKLHIKDIVSCTV